VPGLAGAVRLVAAWRGAVAALFSLVLGLAALVDMGWSSVRRQRLGRRRGGSRRTRGKARSGAIARPYRPSAPPQAADLGAQRRRDLLDAVEEHGASAPKHAQRGRDHQAPDEVRVPARRFARTSAPSRIAAEADVRSPKPGFEQELHAAIGYTHLATPPAFRW